MPTPPPPPKLALPFSSLLQKPPFSIPSSLPSFLSLSPHRLQLYPLSSATFSGLNSESLIMVLLVYFVLLLALTGHSSALYCVCKDGVGDQALQKALDYACGAGADCTPVLQNGACYQPNTVKDHCSYAVNSYFQKKGQAQGSCDFAGTAITSPTVPATSSGCVFPSSASSSTGTGIGTTTTPSTSPTTGITGTTPSTPTSTTPTSTTTGTSSSPTFGISPMATTTTGTGSSGFNDSSKAVSLLQSTPVFTIPLSFLIFCLMYIVRV